MTQSPTAPCRVYIVEDHELMREVLHDYLRAIPGLSVCGDAVSGEEALEGLAVSEPDLVLVDTSLPEMSGIDLVARVRARWPDLPCLMMSGHGQEEYVERALTAGARGYLLKGQPAELRPAIRQVMDGGRYLSPRLRSTEQPIGRP